MEIAYQACWTIGTILGIIGGILASKHSETPGIWLVFSATVILSLGFHLFWQNKVWEKKAAWISARQQKNIKSQLNLSDEDIQKIVDGVACKLMELKQEGDALFGVSNKRIFPNSNWKRRNLYINWKTGRIIRETKDKITIKLPNMHGDIGTIKNAYIGEERVTLYKRVGNKQCPYNFVTELVCVEVVEIKNSVAVVRVAIVKNPHK